MEGLGLLVLADLPAQLTPPGAFRRGAATGAAPRRRFQRQDAREPGHEALGEPWEFPLDVGEGEPRPGGFLRRDGCAALHSDQRVEDPQEGVAHIRLEFGQVQAGRNGERRAVLIGDVGTVMRGEPVGGPEVAGGPDAGQRADQRPRVEAVVVQGVDGEGPDGPHVFHEVLLRHGAQERRLLLGELGRQVVQGFVLPRGAVAPRSLAKATRRQGVLYSVFGTRAGPNQLVRARGLFRCVYRSNSRGSMSVKWNHTWSTVLSGCSVPIAEWPRRLGWGVVGGPVQGAGSPHLQYSLRLLSSFSEVLLDPYDGEAMRRRCRSRSRGRAEESGGGAAAGGTRAGPGPPYGRTGSGTRSPAAHGGAPSRPTLRVAPRSSTRRHSSTW